MWEGRNRRRAIRDYRSHHRRRGGEGRNRRDTKQQKRGDTTHTCAKFAAICPLYANPPRTFIAGRPMPNMLYPLKPPYGFALFGVAEGGCWLWGVYGPAVFGLICWPMPFVATAVLTLSVGVE